MTVKNDEFIEMTPLEKKLAKLAIKYQADFISMKMADAEKIMNKDDWDDLMVFMKHGCRERVVH